MEHPSTHPTSAVVMQAVKACQKQIIHYIQELSTRYGG